MEIRRLVLESEAERPASKSGLDGSGTLTFSGPTLASGGGQSPRLLRPPSKRPLG